MMDIHNYLNIMTGSQDYKGTMITPWELELGHRPPMKTILNHGSEDNYRPQSSLVWGHFKSEMHKGQKVDRKAPRQIAFNIGEKVGFHRKGNMDKRVLTGIIKSLDSDTVVIQAESGSLVTRHRTNVLKLPG